MNVDPALYAELKTALQAAMTGRKNLAAAKDRADKHAAECALAGERLAAAETAAAETAKRAADLIAELGDVRGKTDGLLAEHKKALSKLEREAERVEARRKNLTAGVDRATAALEALSQSLLRAQADCPIDLPEFDEEKYNEKTAQNEQLVATVAANEAEIARREAEVKAHEQSLEKMSKASAERACQESENIRRAFRDHEKQSHAQFRSRRVHRRLYGGGERYSVRAVERQVHHGLRQGKRILRVRLSQ